MSDEESVFNSFVQEDHKTPPRLNRQVAANKDPSIVNKEIKEVLKRVSPTFPSLLFLAIKNGQHFVAYLPSSNSFEVIFAVSICY